MSQELPEVVSFAAGAKRRASDMVLMPPMRIHGAQVATAASLWARRGGERAGERQGAVQTGPLARAHSSGATGEESFKVCRSKRAATDGNNNQKT